MANNEKACTCTMRDFGRFWNHKPNCPMVKREQPAQGEPSLEQPSSNYHADGCLKAFPLAYYPRHGTLRQASREKPHMKPLWHVRLQLGLSGYQGEWNESERITTDEYDRIQQNHDFYSGDDLDKAKEVYKQLAEPSSPPAQAAEKPVAYRQAPRPSGQISLAPELEPSAQAGGAREFYKQKYGYAPQRGETFSVEAAMQFADDYNAQLRQERDALLETVRNCPEREARERAEGALREATNVIQQLHDELPIGGLKSSSMMRFELKRALAALKSSQESK